MPKKKAKRQRLLGVSAHHECAFILKLPDTLLFDIFSSIPLLDRCRGVDSVCQRFRRIAQLTFEQEKELTVVNQRLLCMLVPRIGPFITHLLIGSKLGVWEYFRGRNKDICAFPRLSCVTLDRMPSDEHALIRLFRCYGPTLTCIRITEAALPIRDIEYYISLMQRTWRPSTHKLIRMECRLSARLWCITDAEGYYACVDVDWTNRNQVQDLEMSGIDDELFAAIQDGCSEFPEVTTLMLEGCVELDDVLDGWTAFMFTHVYPKLRNVSIWTCSFDFTSLSLLRNLEQLTFSGLGGQAASPEAWRKISANCRALRKLVLGHNHVTNFFLTMPSLSKLEHLCLGYGPTPGLVQWPFLSLFSVLTNLQYLLMDVPDCSLPQLPEEEMVAVHPAYLDVLKRLFDAFKTKSPAGLKLCVRMFDQRVKNRRHRFDTVFDLLQDMVAFLETPGAQDRCLDFQLGVPWRHSFVPHRGLGKYRIKGYENLLRFAIPKGTQDRFSFDTRSHF